MYFSLIFCIIEVNVVGGRMVEHDQTQLYKNILQNSMLLRTIIQVVQNDGDINVLPVEAKARIL